MAGVVLIDMHSFDGRPGLFWNVGDRSAGETVAEHGEHGDCAPPFDSDPWHAKSPGSSQAYLRHPEGPTYRCFLPDLTGFAGFRRAGPGPQRLQAPAEAPGRTSGGNSTPLERFAGTGHR